ncbi:unnamed protein product [Linum tenue]|uniref:Serpin domain-containing protein n=1 Tax=Linum tenue TaxID=586396 RepID=A0AAV0R6T7_9ROSI|nr:unnamed protein product [Linum tenue]
MISLIALGSEGRTLKQMLCFMGIDGVDELKFLASHLVSSVLLPPGNDNNDDTGHGPIISFVNSAWLDHRFKLKAPFEQTVRSVYRATAKAVDFLDKADQAREEINTWAEKESRSLVRNLLTTEWYRRRDGSGSHKRTLIQRNMEHPIRHFQDTSQRLPHPNRRHHPSPFHDHRREPETPLRVHKRPSGAEDAIPDRTRP